MTWYIDVKMNSLGGIMPLIGPTFTGKMHGTIAGSFLPPNQTITALSYHMTIGDHSVKLIKTSDSSKQNPI